MKIFLIALLIPLCSFSSESVPEFLRHLPVNSDQSQITSKVGGEWYETVTLDGKLAYRCVGTGKFIRAAEYDELAVEDVLNRNHGQKPSGPVHPPDPEMVKIIESFPDKPVHSSPVFESTPEVAVAELPARKNVVAGAVAEFKAIQEKAKEAAVKVEERLADILPVAPKPRDAKIRFPVDLDAPGFVETLSKIHAEKQSEPAKVSAIEKKPETRQATAEQLETMRRFGLSCPPRLVALDGTVTEGISVVTPCGEVNGYKDGQCWRNTPIPCESCRMGRR